MGTLLVGLLVSLSLTVGLVEAVGLDRFKPPCYHRRCRQQRDHGLPRIIHQTVKNRSLVPCDAIPLMSSWPAKNPGFEYWLHDDADCHKLVAQNFPALLPYYEALVAPVERADLFRYFVMEVHGGVYADIDVECVQPINKWDQLYPNISGNASAWIGIEGYHEDQKSATHVGHYYPVQLCQWTMASLPGLRLWTRVAFGSQQVAALQLLQQQSQSSGAGEKFSYQNSILQRTGPGLLSRQVLHLLSINASNVKALQHGAVRRGIKLLPPEAFASGQGHSGAPGRVTAKSLVKHFYFGSWKPADDHHRRALVYCRPQQTLNKWGHPVIVRMTQVRAAR
eukprot:jgi/Chrzof1/6359/Cz18g05180.t1